MYYFYTNRIVEFTKHYYNEINIKEKSREDGIMSLEWVVATAATLIAVVAGLYTIFNNADKRKRTIQSDGECIAKQTSDILYIKDRVDDILLDNKDTNRRLESHETRLALMEDANRRLESIPDRVTNLEANTKKIYKKIEKE